MWLIITTAVFNAALTTVAVTTAEAEYASPVDCAQAAAALSGPARPVVAIRGPDGAQYEELLGWRATSAVCAGAAKPAKSPPAL